MIFSTLISSLAVILSLVDLSTEFECLPNGAPIPSVIRSGTSHSPGRRQPDERRHSPEKANPPANTDSSARASPSVNRSLRVRTRSPPLNNSNLRLREMKLEHYKFVRLIPITNPNRLFEIRQYTFPPDERMYLKERYGAFVPIPTKGQNVLSTSDGYAFAIMDGTKKLRAIFLHRNRDLSRSQGAMRVKINMENGEAEDMTPEEIKETPVGRSHLIANNFRTALAGDFHI